MTSVRLCSATRQSRGQEVGLPAFLRETKNPSALIPAQMALVEPSDRRKTSLKARIEVISHSTPFIVQLAKVNSRRFRDGEIMTTEINGIAAGTDGERVGAFDDDESRWKAVVQKDRAADGVFFYSVTTTGVYCRPCCPARLARRENVSFHETVGQARRAGFRPCKRCRPDDVSLDKRQSEIVTRACRLIETGEEIPNLADLAAALDVSQYHFHRMFKAVTGLTPKAYAAGHRAQRVRNELTEGTTVTETYYRAGFNSSGRFYATSTEQLGMTPSAFRAGGTGIDIRFAVGECSLGSILVAASDKGVCAILLGDDPDALARDLQDRFSKANLIGGDETFDRWVAEVVGFVENPSVGLTLPLDIRGTSFQVRVWDALRQIPPGATVSYAEVAKRIGQPTAVRAIAQACGANPLAVAIPCHRVVRNDKSISGYRWGVERKTELLRRERTAN
jgi:AraC family transcriptional regulator, regulatory protein of adaptative response / methylated-DNA-[protein]-cysteine methyltransferase